MDDIGIAIHEGEIHELQATCAGLRAEVTGCNAKIADLMRERDRALDAGESLRAELKRTHAVSEAALADRTDSSVDLGVHLETMCKRLEGREEVAVEGVVGALRCLGRLFAEASAAQQRYRKALDKIAALEPGSKGAYSKFVTALTIAKDAFK